MATYAGKLSVGGTTIPIGSTLYGTCDTGASTAAKVVTCANFDKLLTGVTIHVKFTHSNTNSSPTLNVNSTGAKNIYRYGTTKPGTTAKTSWQAGAVISFTYDGSYWQMNDWLNDDSTYTASSTTPAMDGTGVVGTSTDYARADHVHPSDTSRVPTTRTVNSKALSADITLSASDVGAIASSLKGAASGVAELDANGLVPTSQLPSYVDDVLEYTAKSSFPTTGETGKIYVDTTTNLTYRWSGSAYVEISPSLALGTTSSTAFRGDYGNTSYTHATDSSRLTTATASGLYKVAATAQGHIASLTAVEKADITGLGIPGSDTNNAVTQTATTTSANYEVLFSSTADNTTRTEGARKNNNLLFNPSTGNLQATQLNGVTIGSSPKFSDTTYSAGTGLSLSSTTFNHSNSVTAGTAGTSSATSGSSIAIPYVTYDAQGHITASGTHTHSTTVAPSKVVTGSDATAGDIDPVTAAYIPIASSNKSFGLPAEAITIEYSTDAGSTWTDYGANNQSKENLFNESRASSFSCGKATAKANNSVNNQLRITIEPTDRYCSFHGVYLWFNTTGNTVVMDLERSTIGAKNTFNSVFTGKSLAGWSGNNIIYFPQGQFGGGTSQTSNYYKYRITIRQTAINANYPSAYVYDIRFLGYNVWTYPTSSTYSANMVKYKTPYSADGSGNVTFPAEITATDFNGTVNGYSIAASVPSGAKFTDTTYTAQTTSIGSASTGTAIPADDITAWSAGTAAIASVSAGVLTITNGTAPSLSYTAKSIPNISVTSTTVATGITAS